MYLNSNQIPKLYPKLPELPELSQLQEMVPKLYPETHNMVDEKLQLEIGGFSPDVDVEWDNNLLTEMEKYLTTYDLSWEQYIEGSLEVDKNNAIEVGGLKYNLRSAKLYIFFNYVTSQQIWYWNEA